MKPKYITAHCSATKANSDIGAAEITVMHKRRGFRTVGYHFVIRRNGEIETGRPLMQQGAHVKGHNRDNIGICLIGGVDDNNKPENNFTRNQFDSLRYLITDLSSKYGIKEVDIKGHRDWFPDLNGDGILDRRDWLKDCPAFTLAKLLQEWKL